MHFGRYELLKKIATGGMGEVFLARLGADTVVVKRLLPHLASNEASKALFLQEARLASQVRHPNLVKVLELGQAEGQWFMAMEYVRGLSLHEVMSRGPMAIDEAMRVVADVAGALAAVHSARDAKGRLLEAAHRDVTPRNVILGPAKVVKLIDFGVSGARGQGGTLEYAAPEGAVDARSDQFSLGVILWELLSGRGLFHGDSDAQTIDLIEAGVIAPLPVGVGPELTDVVLRMLAKEAASRFSSCDEVRLHLLELLDVPTAPLLSSSLKARVERPMTSFVGRRAELAAIERLAQEGASSLTITGRAGLGKRRLALQVQELPACKGVEVLTALEPTGAADETVYELPPLSVADAAALYAARSGGASTSARALDGLALTVELMAVREATKSVDLHGAFDASWAALRPAARSLLVALTRHEGSVTLEQAEVISAEALELLEAARDAALIQVVEAGNGDLRFALHDAIRALIRISHGRD